MTTCANCKTAALYTYITTPYCDRHLPRFLRDRYGKPNHLVSKTVAVAKQATINPVTVPTTVEPLEEPEVYAEVAEEAPKKKAAPKAE